MSRFEVYKDKAGEFRFRYKARNGETMFASEGYTAKASAMDAIESIKKNVADAKVEDLTLAAKAEAPKPAAAAKPKAAKTAAKTAAKDARDTPAAPAEEPAKG